MVRPLHHKHFIAMCCCHNVSAIAYHFSILFISLLTLTPYILCYNVDIVYIDLY